MRKLWIMAAVLVVAYTAAAEQFAFVGARAMGMGGANAASVHDAMAQWHNPAVFGFMGQRPTNEVDSAATTNDSTGVLELVGKMADSDSATSETATSVAPANQAADGIVARSNISTNGEVLSVDVLETPKEEPEYNLLDNNGLSDRVFGWNVIGFGTGYAMTKDMGHYLDILTDIDFENIDNVSTPEEVSDLVAMAAALKGIGTDGNAFYVDTSAGSSIRIGSFGIGVRMFGEAAVWVDELDTDNLGLAVNMTTLNTDLDAVRASEGFPPGGYTPRALTGLQVTGLTDAGLSLDNAHYLDFKLSELLADGTLQPSDIDGSADLLADIVAASGGGDLDDNLTAVAARGFAMAEVPVSYGRAINENLSVGITAKAMFGRVLGTKIWVFDEDNLDNAVENVTDTESDTLTFGIDLGALYRMKNFQFALVGHNLNRPTFDGYTDTVIVNGNPETIVVPDVKIDPQINVGAAFIPSKRVTLEASLDLLETGTLLDGYDIQRLSFGGEIDLWMLAFRLGAYRNLAANWQDWVATAGVGLNLYAFRFDVGGAYSLGDNATYDGTEIPTEARLYAGLSVDF